MRNLSDFRCTDYEHPFQLYCGKGYAETPQGLSSMLRLQLHPGRFGGRVSFGEFGAEDFGDGRQTGVGALVRQSLRHLLQSPFLERLLDRGTALCGVGEELLDLGAQFHLAMSGHEGVGIGRKHRLGRLDPAKRGAAMLYDGARSFLDKDIAGLADPLCGQVNHQISAVMGHAGLD